MHHKRTEWTLFICALMLAGCGGGGGGSVPDNNSSTITDTGSSSLLAPVSVSSTVFVPYLDTITVPASTYPSGSAELGAWSVLQQARLACGFGQLTQNTLLDKAAKLHAQYQISVSQATGSSVFSHYETVTTDPYYRGYYPWDRTQAQGYGKLVSEILEATTWDYSTSNPPIIPPLEQRGAASMRNLLNTVYHLTGAMYKGADIGFGAELQTQTNGTSAHEEYRFGSLNGFQTQILSIGAGQLATYPCDGSSTVPSYFTPAHESPNPFPAMTSVSQQVGPPIYLKVDEGQNLTLNSASIVDANGVSMAYTTLNASNDPAQEIKASEVFVIPNAALQPNSSYLVTLTGTISQPRRPATTFTRSFTLKTGA